MQWVIARITPLLEREDQLATVEGLIRDASDGQGVLVLLEGAPGIGKSRMVSASSDAAAALGAQVLGARGGELERDFSYGVVRQLFETRLASCGDDERARLFSGAARLSSPLFEFGESASLARGEDASQASLHGLFWLTANLAELGPLPLLLAVDDVHLCDAPSLRYLSYLAHRLEGLPVAVVASARTGDSGVDAGVLHALESEPVATVVRLAPLSREAVRRLLRERLGSDPAEEFVQTVHASSGGNPFLLNELVHAVLVEGIEPTASAAARIPELGPESLSRFVLQRLRRLGSEAEALARAVAILGEEQDLEVAAALAGIDPGVASA